MTNAGFYSRTITSVTRMPEDTHAVPRILLLAAMKDTLDMYMRLLSDEQKADVKNLAHF